MPAGDTAREYVLDALAGNDIPVNSTALTWYLEQRMQRPPSRSTVERALKALAGDGLVENPYKNYYWITDEGRAYMAGDLHVDELDS